MVLRGDYLDLNINNYYIRVVGGVRRESIYI